MTRWDRMVLIALPAALLLSVSLRFIHHSDREYTYWIDLHREGVAWLEARCAELHTPGACGTAQERRAFLDSLESYRARVNFWRWPVAALAAVAWAGVIVSITALLWQSLRRRE